MFQFIFVTRDGHRLKSGPICARLWLVWVRNPCLALNNPQTYTLWSSVTELSSILTPLLGGIGHPPSLHNFVTQKWHECLQCLCHFLVTLGWYLTPFGISTSTLRVTHLCHFWMVSGIHAHGSGPNQLILGLGILFRGCLKTQNCFFSSLWRSLLVTDFSTSPSMLRSSDLENLSMIDEASFSWLRHCRQFTLFHCKISLVSVS